MRNYKCLLIFIISVFFSNSIYGQFELVEIEEVIKRAHLVSKIGNKEISDSDITGTYKFKFNNRIGYSLLLIVAYEAGNGEFNLKRIDSLYGDGNDAEEIAKAFLQSRNKQDKITFYSSGDVEFYPSTTNSEGTLIDFSWSISDDSKIVQVKSKNFKKGTKIYLFEKQSDDLYIVYFKIGELPYLVEKFGSNLKDYFLEYAIIRKEQYGQIKN